MLEVIYIDFGDKGSVEAATDVLVRIQSADPKNDNNFSVLVTLMDGRGVTPLQAIKLIVEESGVEWLQSLHPYTLAKLTRILAESKPR